MGSRLKEEEKHERAIRALLKQAENRRCINCASLGPQYVCTTFSIFVCTNCSGLHREFSHRIKSVSMAKFTAAEVAALQAGGNEAARDVFFKEWDSQRNALPDNSNPDRLRDFIKSVYEERRYTGERPAAASKVRSPPKSRTGDRDDSYESRRPESRSDYRPESRTDRRPDSRSPPFEDRYDDRRFERRRSDADRGRYDDRRNDDRIVRFEDKRSPGRFEPDRSRYERGQYDERRFDDKSRYDDRDRRFEDRIENETRHDRRRSADDRPSKDYDSSPPVRPVSEILGDNVTLRVEEVNHSNGRDDDNHSFGSVAESRKDSRIARPASFGRNVNSAAAVIRVNSGSLIDFSGEPDTSGSTPDSFGVSTAKADLFGPSQTKADPFGASQAKVDPFGSSQGKADPFGPSQSNLDPFGSSQAKADPFRPLQAKADPFGPSQAKTDPFGQSQAKANLFGGSNAAVPQQSAVSLNNTGWATFDTGPLAALPDAGPPAGYPELFPSNGGPWHGGGWKSGSTASAPASDSWSSLIGQVQPNSQSTGSQPWSSFPSSSTSDASQHSMQQIQHGLLQDQPALSTGLQMAPSLDRTRELPKELFAQSFSGHPTNGLQMGVQVGFPPAGPQFTGLGPMPTYMQPPRSRNPFDLPGDMPPMSMSTFPPMGSLQAALPGLAPGPVTIPGSGPLFSNQWSMGPPPATFPPGLNNFPGQHSNSSGMTPASVMSARAQGPNSFSGRPVFPADSSFPGQGLSEFPQSSTRPLGGNPFG